MGLLASCGRGRLELGTVRGEAVDLPMHFHWEDQMTFVLSGRRRFVVGDEVVVLEAGDGTVIPAGVATPVSVRARWRPVFQCVCAAG
jgi:mannose-6-phosphate isomerase-like protein (cupin superfamily)